MTYRIALLLNIAANSYQQALADEARETARKHGFELLPPAFANGSAMEQGSAALAYSRQNVSSFNWMRSAATPPKTMPPNRPLPIGSASTHSFAGWR